MWQNKQHIGTLPPATLALSPAGTITFYQAETLAALKPLRVLVQSYATKARAVYRQTTIYGHTAAGAPVYLLKVEVVTQGQQLKRRGRKSHESGKGEAEKC